MASYPVMSQLFVYTERSAAGKGWRVGPTSRIAYYYLEEEVYEQPKGSIDTCVNSVRFSTERVGPELWGRFAGLTCSAKSLYAVRETLHRARLHD